MRTAAFAACCVLACGCGYVGDPLPPALNIPERVTDLKVSELGVRIVLEFTPPKLTTERLPIKKLEAVEIQFDGQLVATESLAEERGRIEIPVEKWIGRTLHIRVRPVANGKAADWSNEPTLAVIAPLTRPEGLAASADARGVRVSWQPGARPGIGYIVFRKSANEKEPAAVGKTNDPSFVDAAAEYGKPYEYSVQASLEQALSEMAGPVEITAVDTFAPAVPAAVTANRGVNSIELAWDRNTEPDFRAYRVYRAVKGAEAQVLADSVDAPAYSDRQLESGKEYVYSITAVDQRGNESARSTPIEVVAP